MSKVESALAQAAEVFETELAQYARLGELFLKTPLSSVKHLERANTTLAEIAACEERLQAAGQALVKVLGGARDRQEQLSAAVVAHVPALQARNTKLKELMTEMGAVAGDVAGLNEQIQQHSNGGNPSVAEAKTLSTAVFALAERAKTLAATAHEAELEEVGTQAHSLHQRLDVIGKKLERAGGD